ncbi:MAG: YHYH protein [Proteobacteria bacterium]|nr:YHYH protein [Pseudomonadota bacterium]
MALLFASSAARAHGVEATNHTRQPSPSGISWVERFFGAQAAVTVRIDGNAGHRYVKSDGRPNHPTGAFPNRANPHAIKAQSFEYRMPLRPSRAERISFVGHGDFGVASNGIPFDAATAEFWNRDRWAGWNYEAIGGAIDLGLDRNNAHVQPDGTYHYHGVPVGLIQKTNYRSHPRLIGFAADGFPIYAPYGYRDPHNTKSGIKELQPSYRVKRGNRSSGPGGRHDGRFGRDFEYVKNLGDLDRCNGRIGVTPEYPQGVYYYVITSSFPYVPRCWIGSPDASFKKFPGKRRGIDPAGEQGAEPTAPPQPQTPGSDGPGQGPQGRHEGGEAPPQEAIQACVGRRLGQACSFRAPVGQAAGVCRSVRSGEKACVPNWHRGGRLGSNPGRGPQRGPGLGPLRPDRR